MDRGKKPITLDLFLGTRSTIYVVFALRRHMIYFLLQLYIPCTLIVFLSWVGLWLNREATNDRINLGNYGMNAAHGDALSLF